jgi:hypothetical protein
MAERDAIGAIASKISFSELEELPPLKETFVPSISDEPATEQAAPILPPLSGKKVAEKPQIAIREVAQKAVAEIRKTPPKLYVYGVGGAVLLIAVIVAAMAMHNYLEDHDSDGSRAAAPAVATKPVKHAAPAPAPNPAPDVAANTAPAPPSAAIEPPAQPEPAVTVEEQPEASTVSPSREKNKKKIRAAAPALAQLTVSSVPAGAQITFDGSALCQSPCELTDIAPGRHVIAANRAGYSSQSRTITLRAGSSAVAFQLTSATTTLMVSSTPAGAAIVIDGRDTGRLTPTLFSFEKAGSHTVLIRRAGFLEGTSTVSVQSGQSSNVNLSLKRLGNTDEIRSAGGKFKKVFGRGSASNMGTVSVKTQPKGAEIEVNGRVLEKTAPYDFYLNPGTYVVDISMSGYRSLHRVIDVEEGEKVAIEESLSPE